jgi:hypothetical protein
VVRWSSCTLADVSLRLAVGTLPLRDYMVSEGVSIDRERCEFCPRECDLPAGCRGFPTAASLPPRLTAGICVCVLILYLLFISAFSVCLALDDPRPPFRIPFSSDPSYIFLFVKPKNVCSLCF